MPPAEHQVAICLRLMRRYSSVAGVKVTRFPETFRKRRCMKRKRRKRMSNEAAKKERAKEAERDAKRVVEQEQRRKLAVEFRIQLEGCRFGLPTDKRTGAPLKQHTEITDFAAATRAFAALRELNVRLNVWVANGNRQTGTIDFPEARREIVYKLLGDPSASTVILRARK